MDLLQLAVAASAVAVAVSLVALMMCFRGTVPHRHNVLETRLRELDAELVDVLDNVDKLTKVAKRKYSRDVARKNRETKTDPDETDADWVRRMNLEMATGQRRRPI